MRELDAQTHVRERAQHTAAIRGGVAQDVLQLGAGKALHHEEWLAALIDSDVVDRYDGRMLQPRLHARFAHEPRDLFGGRLVAADALDRDLAADLVIECEHDLTHATDAESFTDAIARTVRNAERRRCVASPSFPFGLRCIV
jgi:hypothetical protein